MNKDQLRLAKIDAWRVYVPLLEEWTTSPEFGDHVRGSDSLVVRLEDTEGNCGYGEGDCLLSGASLESALRRFLDTPAASIRSTCLDLHAEPTYWHQPLPPSPFSPDLGNLKFRIRHLLQTAVETAWLDLVSRRAGVAMSQLFGGAWRDRVPTSYWMGRVTPDHARRCVARGKSLGFTGVKLKTTLEDENVARLEAIAGEAGPDFEVTVDPNGRFYRLDDALPTIRAMDAVGNMEILEDPFARFPVVALEESAALRPLMRARLVLQVNSPEVLHPILVSRAAGGLNLDSHVQGLLGFRLSAAAAEAANLPVWHGSNLDLGIATAAQLHLCAATPNCQLPGDQMGPWLRESSLVKENFVVEQGQVLVPPGPGHGVTFDPDAAEVYVLERFTLKA